jgi:hypothetical protein
MPLAKATAALGETCSVYGRELASAQNGVLQNLVDLRLTRLAGGAVGACDMDLQDRAEIVRDACANCDAGRERP